MPIWLLVIIIVSSVIVGIFLLSLIIGFSVFIGSCTNKILDNRKKDWESTFDDETKSMMDKPWFIKEVLPNKVTIKAKDHLSLFGYLIKGNNHNYIVYCHGYGGFPYEKSKILHDIYDKYHCNILCIVQRAQNGNKAHFLTMGIKEGRDLSCWCKYISKMDPLAKIVVYGQSLGAATVMNSFNFDMPKNVTGAIEDCGYVNVLKQFMFSGTGYVPKFLLGYICWFMCLSMYLVGINYLGSSPLKGIKKIKVPFLSFHGEIDEVVPFSNFAEVAKYQQSPNFFSKSFPGAVHTKSYVINKKEYMDLIDNLLSISFSK